MVVKSLPATVWVTDEEGEVRVTLNDEGEMEELVDP